MPANYDGRKLQNSKLKASRFQDKARKHATPVNERAALETRRQLGNSVNPSTEEDNIHPSTPAELCGPQDVASYCQGGPGVQEHQRLSCSNAKACALTFTTHGLCALLKWLK